MQPRHQSIKSLYGERKKEGALNKLMCLRRRRRTRTTTTTKRRHFFLGCCGCDGGHSNAHYSRSISPLTFFAKKKKRKWEQKCPCKTVVARVMETSRNVFFAEQKEKKTFLPIANNRREEKGSLDFIFLSYVATLLPSLPPLPSPSSSAWKKKNKKNKKSKGLPTFLALSFFFLFLLVPTLSSAVFRGDKRPFSFFSWLIFGKAPGATRTKIYFFVIFSLLPPFRLLEWNIKKNVLREMEKKKKNDFLP